MLFWLFYTKKLWHVIHTVKDPMDCKFFSLLSCSILKWLLPISAIGAWRQNQLLKHVLRMLYFNDSLDKAPKIQASGFLIPCQLALLDAEDEGTAVHLNVSNYLPVNMVQHPGSLESSATLLWQLAISGKVLLDCCSNNMGQWPGYCELGNKCVCFTKGGKFLD